MFSRRASSVGRFNRRGIGSASSWRPTQLSGCVLWLRADLGITKDGSDKVSAWADQSGAGNNVTQATGTKQPTWVAGALGGQAALSFDGGDVLASAPSNWAAYSTISMAMVFVKDNAAASVAFSHGVPSSSNGLAWWQDVGAAGRYSVAVDSSGATWTQRAASGYSAGTNYVALMTVDTSLAAASEVTLRVNGTAVTLGTLVGGDQSGNLGGVAVAYCIGAQDTTPNFGMSGDIAEVIVCSTAWSASEIASIEAYARRRYGAW